MTDFTLNEVISIAESYINESARTPYDALQGDRRIVSTEIIVDCGAHSDCFTIGQRRT